MLSDIVVEYFGDLRTLSGRSFKPTDMETQQSEKKKRDRHSIKFTINGQRTKNVER